MWEPTRKGMKMTGPQWKAFKERNPHLFTQKDKPAPAVVSTKFCRNCNRNLPRSAFYASATNVDGLYGRCKFCHNLQTRQIKKDREAKVKEVLKKVAECGDCWLILRRAGLINGSEGK